MLLDENDRRLYLKRFRTPNLENLARQNFSKKVNTACRKVVHCPYCGSTNGVVKKIGLLKIIHEKFRQKKTHPEMEQWRATFSAAVDYDKAIGGLLSKAHEDLNPLKVLDLFRRISAEVNIAIASSLVHTETQPVTRTANSSDYIQARAVPRSSSGNTCRFRRHAFGRLWLKRVLRRFLSIIASAFCYSLLSMNRSNEDDITVKLTDIVAHNSYLRVQLAKGASIQQVAELWATLSESVAIYINSETPGLPATVSDPDLQSVSHGV